MGGWGGNLHGSLDSGQGVVEDATVLGALVPSGDGRPSRVGEGNGRKPVPRGGNSAHGYQRRQEYRLNKKKYSKFGTLTRMLERSTLGLFITTTWPLDIMTSLDHVHVDGHASWKAPECKHTSLAVASFPSDFILFILWNLWYLILYISVLGWWWLHRSWHYSCQNQMQ